MNIELSPAQRAAQTRAARKAGLATPTAANAENTALARNADVLLDLVIREDALALAIGFRFVKDGNVLSRADTPELERGLLDLGLFAYLGESELFGYRETVFRGAIANAASLRAVLGFMTKLDKFVALAIEESEDPSFALVVNCIAAHLRATRIVHVQEDGSEITFKRGAAYISAHRIAEAFVAKHAPKPEKAPKKAA